MPESDVPEQTCAEPAPLNGGALAQPIAADQVAAYLRRHPDFLARHPDLLDVLALPARDHGKGVVDLQQFMVERLRRANAELSDLRNDLVATGRSAEHTSDLQSLMRRSYAVFCLQKKKNTYNT